LSYILILHGKINDLNTYFMLVYLFLNALEHTRIINVEKL